MPYKIHPLKREDRERAYALVRLMKPELDIEHWQAFLEAALEPGASRRPQGVTVGSVGEDTLVGLYTWEVQPSLDHGSVLAVDNLIATGPLNPAPLLKDLLSYIEDQAADHSCDVIQIVLPGQDHVGLTETTAGPMFDGFMRNGFAINDQMLCKQRKQAPN